MKYLGLVVFLLFAGHSLAATNRTTLWILADEQVASSSKGYQPCQRLATADTTDFNVLVSTYLTIVGQDAKIKDDAAGNFQYHIR